MKKLIIIVIVGFIFVGVNFNQEAKAISQTERTYFQKKIDLLLIEIKLLQQKLTLLLRQQNIEQIKSQTNFNKNDSVSPVKQVTNNNFTTLPLIPDSDIKISDSEPVGYFVKLISQTQTINIDTRYLKDIRQPSGLVYTVPILFDRLRSALATNNFNQIRSTKSGLKGWLNYFQKTYSNLKKMTVNPLDLKYHKTMIAWLKYNTNIINQILNQNLTVNVMNQYIRGYLSVYNQNKSQLANSIGNVLPQPYHQPESLLAVITNQLKNSFLSLIKKAQAILTGFGGRITIVLPTCTNGQILTISGVKGGVFFLDFLTMANNPYRYNVIAPGVNILGTAYSTPQVCVLPPPSPPTPCCPQGLIMKYGTSTL